MEKIGESWTCTTAICFHKGTEITGGTLGVTGTTPFRERSPLFFVLAALEPSTTLVVRVFHWGSSFRRDNNPPSDARRTKGFGHL